MSSKNVPWEGYEDGPGEFFTGLKPHWPHYIAATCSFGYSFSISRTVEFADVYEWTEGDPPEGHIECAATSRTDTWSGSASGTFNWGRMSTADETYGLDPADEEFDCAFNMRSPTATEDIEAAFGFGNSSTITGSTTQTLHTGNACDITATTTLGVLSVTSDPGDVAVSQTDEELWVKSHDIGGGYSMLNLSDDGPGIPFIPTMPGNETIALSGPPEGSNITFSFSETVNAADVPSLHAAGWTGSISLNYTFTLST
jgi:hypothetical protein